MGVGMTVIDSASAEVQIELRHARTPPGLFVSEPCSAPSFCEPLSRR